MYEYLYTGEKPRKIAENWIECESNNKETFRKQIFQAHPARRDVCYIASIKSLSNPSKDFLMFERHGFDFNYADQSTIQNLEKQESELSQKLRCRPYGAIALNLEYFSKVNQFIFKRIFFKYKI